MFFKYSILILTCVSIAWALECSDQPQEYDIGNLTKPKFWALNNVPCFDQSDPICEIFFSFCNQLPNYKNCSEGSVCQYDENATIFELGKFNNNPFMEKEDFNGFYAKFKGGTILNKFTNKMCNLSVLVEFDCNKNEYWNSTEEEDMAPTPRPLNYTGITKDSCEIYFKFNYAGACHRITPPITTTEINPPPSKICIPPKNYDITLLTAPPYWQFNIANGCAIENVNRDACILSVGFCKPLEEVGCQGASACIRYPNDPSATIIVGNFSEDPFDSFGIDQFSADYPNGEQITNMYTNKTCLTSLSVLFVCDLESNWNVPPDNEPGIVPKIISFSSISNSSCQINVTVPFSGACSKNKPKDNGLSSGSILLIIFFVSLTVYLLFGGGYNFIVEKQTGLQVIPHYKFWSSCLLFSLEGLIFAWRFVTCQKSKDKLLKYDSI